MNMTKTVATIVMKSNVTLRPSGPATGFMKPMIGLPGPPFPDAQNRRRTK
jgi:hypothetical protein